MSSHRQKFLALAGAVLLAATVAAEQATPTPRPKLISPVRGLAEVHVTRPVTKRDGKMVVTTMRVQNKANGPIAGLKVDEFWYDKGGDPVTGGTFRNPKPLMPNEVIEVTIRTPSVPDMDRNSYKFVHANGEVKTTNVAKIDAPKS
jgi:hypothetical protein